MVAPPPRMEGGGRGRVSGGQLMSIVDDVKCLPTATTDNRREVDRVRDNNYGSFIRFIAVIG